MTVRFGRQAGSKTPGSALFVLGSNFLFLPLPGNAEWWIGNDIVELIAAEFIIRKCIAKLHIVRITPTNQHVCFGNTESERVELLTENIHVCLAVQRFEAFFHAGQHLTGTHGHIVDSFADAIFFKGIPVPGHQQVTHKIDNISAGEVRSCFLVIRLGESLNKVFKDIAHIHRRDIFGGEIRLFRIEVRNHLIQEAAFHHAVNL